MVCVMAACAAVEPDHTDPSAETTAPTIVQTEPDGFPTTPSVAPSVPVETPPVGSEPEETVPQLTLPEVGEDPGGFGPIF